MLKWTSKDNSPSRARLLFHMRRSLLAAGGQEARRPPSNLLSRLSMSWRIGMRLNRTVSLALVALLAFGLAPATGSPAGSKKSPPASKPGLSQLLAIPASASQRLIGIA